MGLARGSWRSCFGLYEDHFSGSGLGLQTRGLGFLQVMEGVPNMYGTGLIRIQGLGISQCNYGFLVLRFVLDELGQLQPTFV